MKKGISTVIATLLMLIITIALAGFAYTYLSGVLTAQTAKTVELIGAVDCITGTSHILTVKNLGTSAITAASEISVTVDGSAATCTWSSATLSSGGGISTCTTGAAGVSAGSHRIRITGPGNVLSGTSLCP